MSSLWRLPTHRRGVTHHAGELHFAHTKRAPLADAPEPTEEETEQLPHRIEPEATGHDRIVLEVAFEEPEVRLNFEFRPDLAFAEQASEITDMADPIEHQQRRQRQLGVSRAEQLTARAGEKGLEIEGSVAYLLIQFRSGALFATPVLENHRAIHI